MGRKGNPLVQFQLADLSKVPVATLSLQQNAPIQYLPLANNPSLPPANNPSPPPVNNRYLPISNSPRPPFANSPYPPPANSPYPPPASNPSPPPANNTSPLPASSPYQSPRVSPRMLAPQSAAVLQPQMQRFQSVASPVLLQNSFAQQPQKQQQQCGQEQRGQQTFCARETPPAPRMGTPYSTPIVPARTPPIILPRAPHWTAADACVAAAAAAPGHTHQVVFQFTNEAEQQQDRPVQATIRGPCIPAQSSMRPACPAPPHVGGPTLPPPGAWLSPRLAGQGGDSTRSVRPEAALSRPPVMHINSPMLAPRGPAEPSQPPRVPSAEPSQPSQFVAPVSSPIHTPNAPLSETSTNVTEDRTSASAVSKPLLEMDAVYTPAATMKLSPRVIPPDSRRSPPLNNRNLTPVRQSPQATARNISPLTSPPESRRSPQSNARTSSPVRTPPEARPSPQPIARSLSPVPSPLAPQKSPQLVARSFSPIPSPPWTPSHPPMDAGAGVAPAISDSAKRIRPKVVPPAPTQTTVAPAPTQLVPSAPTQALIPPALTQLVPPAITHLVPPAPTQTPQFVANEASEGQLVRLSKLATPIDIPVVTLSELPSPPEISVVRMSEGQVSVPVVTLSEDQIAALSTPPVEQATSKNSSLHRFSYQGAAPSAIKRPSTAVPKVQFDREYRVARIASPLASPRVSSPVLSPRVSHASDVTTLGNGIPRIPNSARSSLGIPNSARTSLKPKSKVFTLGHHISIYPDGKIHEPRCVTVNLSQRSGTLGDGGDFRSQRSDAASEFCSLRSDASDDRRFNEDPFAMGATLTDAVAPSDGWSAPTTPARSRATSTATTLPSRSRAGSEFVARDRVVSDASTLSVTSPFSADSQVTVQRDRAFSSVSNAQRDRSFSSASTVPARSRVCSIATSAPGRSRAGTAHTAVSEAMSEYWADETISTAQVKVAAMLAVQRIESSRR